MPRDLLPSAPCRRVPQPEGPASVHLLKQSRIGDASLGAIASWSNAEIKDCTISYAIGSETGRIRVASARAAALSRAAPRCAKFAPARMR